jgi:hypothetical protein
MAERALRERRASHHPAPTDLGEGVPADAPRQRRPRGGGSHSFSVGPADYVRAVICSGFAAVASPPQLKTHRREGAPELGGAQVPFPLRGCCLDIVR